MDTMVHKWKKDRQSFFLVLNISNALQMIISLFGICNH